MPILGIIASGISGHLFAPSGAYESIATVSVGGGGAADVEFTSIPATYTHLQIRGIGAMTASGPDDLRIRFNADTGNNYARHYIVGSGSAASASGTATTSFGIIGANPLPTTANTFGAAIVDILDYANTNKYKTMRALAGYDANGSGYVGLSSALWQNTNAITSIKLYPAASTFPQYSSFALYGIKGA
jgi:hypothetical protein